MWRKITYSNIPLTRLVPRVVGAVMSIILFFPVTGMAQAIQWPFFYPAEPFDIEGALLVIYFFSLALAMPFCCFLLGEPLEDIYIMFSQLSICAAVSLSAQLEVKSFFIGQPVFWELIAMTTTFLLPAALYSFIAQCDGPGKHQYICGRLVRIHLVYSMAALIFFTAKLASFAVLVNLFYYITAVTGIVIAHRIYKLCIRDSLAGKIIIAGIGLFFFSLGISYIYKTSSIHYFAHWGMALMLLVFSLLLRIHIIGEERKARSQFTGTSPVSTGSNSNPYWRYTDLEPEPLSTQAAQTPENNAKGPEPAPADIEQRIACFAHEINSPLGNGILAASHLEQKIEELSRLFQEGHIKKSDFEQHLHCYGESADIILSNLTNARDMVKAFRQGPADSLDDNRCLFDMKKQVEKTLLSLKQQLERQNSYLETIYEGDLLIHGFPRLFSQIIINLVNNSLIHAIEPGKQGHLVLSICRQDEIITVTYSDNGQGMNQTTLNNIFTPYFSTKKEYGSTGLGLSIVKSIVTGKFGGTITCKSEVGQGTTFTIRFPIT